MMREKLAESNSLIEHPNPQKWAQSIVWEKSHHIIVSDSTYRSLLALASHSDTTPEQIIQSLIKKQITT
jgi:hypothetical protein